MAKKIIYSGKKSKLKTALIITGGFSKGAIQVGIIETILKKIIPDVIIGTGAGAINASLIAHNTPIKEIEQIWDNLEHEKLFPMNKELLYKFYKASSLYDNQKWIKWVNSISKHLKFKDAKIPLYINATNMVSGKNKVFNSGEISNAILATTALPPYLPPYKVGNSYYVDGIFSDMVATDIANKLKCSQLIVVNLNYNGQKHRIKRGALHILNTGLEYLSYQAFQKELALAKQKNIVIIEPKKAGYFESIDFSNTKKLIKEGRKVAKEKIKKIII